MKKPKKQKRLKTPSKSITITVNYQTTLRLFKNLDNSLQTGGYVFRQDLKNYDGEPAVGFRVKGHKTMFEIQNIMIKLGIRCVTFLKGYHGPDENSEIHIDPQFTDVFFDVCTKINRTVSSQQKQQIQLTLSGFLYDKVH